MRIQNSRARKRINWIVTSQSTKQRRRTTTTTQIQIQPEQQIQIQPGTATDTDTSEYASRWSSAWTEQNREGREGNQGKGRHGSSGLQRSMSFRLIPLKCDPKKRTAHCDCDCDCVGNNKAKVELGTENSELAMRAPSVTQLDLI